MRPRQQVFVNEMLRHGDHVKAYLAAYPKCKESSARNAANRLLQDAEVHQAINGPQQRIRAEIEAELRQKLEAEILEELQIKLLLSRIATGQLETEKLVRTKDGSYDTIKVKPNHNHILRALYMLSRMMGKAVPLQKAGKPIGAVISNEERNLPGFSNTDDERIDPTTSEASGDFSLCCTSFEMTNAIDHQTTTTTNNNISTETIHPEPTQDFTYTDNSSQLIDPAASVTSGDFSLRCTSFEMTGGIEQQTTTNSINIISDGGPRNCFFAPPGNDESEIEQQKTTNQDFTGYSRLRDVWTEAWETNHYKQDTASYRHYRNMDWLSQSANFPAEQRQIIEIETGWEFHPENSSWIRKRGGRELNKKSPAEQGFNINEIC